MGCSVGRIRSQAHKALAKLRVSPLLTTGAAVIAGGASGLGIALGGPHRSGTQQVPPGQNSSLSLERSRPSRHVQPRHVPAFTQQAGQGDVVASGTDNGMPWQVTMTTDAKSGGAALVRLTLTNAGSYVDDVGFRDDPSSVGAMETQKTVLPTYEWFSLVPPDVTDVGWIGADGFRHDQPTLPARPYGSVGEWRLVVFPSRAMNMQVGDRFVGFDSGGRQVVVVAEVASDPR